MTAGSEQSRIIAIVGGSYGGVSTAHYLLKHVLPKLSDCNTYSVVLVSASSQVLCRPACPRALIKDEFFPQQKLFVTIADQFQHYQNGAFRFIQGRVTELDHTERSIQYQTKDGSSHKLTFHAVVLATGASTHSPLFGLNKDESELRNSWAVLRKALPNAKAIVISGGGPTGVETAGELGEYLNGRPGWFSSGAKTPAVQITVVTSAAEILPVLRNSLAAEAQAYLSQVGVQVMKNARVVSVQPDGAGTNIDKLTEKATITLSNGSTLEADLYIPAYGTIPNTSFVSKDLLAADGRVEVNQSTLRIDKAGPLTYGIGDCTTYARAAVHNVLAAVPVLCANIKRDLAGEGTATSSAADRIFTEDTRETQLVPIGQSKGVGSAMGWRLPSFVVWLVKGRDYWLWTTGDLWNGKHWKKET